MDLTLSHHAGFLPPPTPLLFSTAVVHSGLHSQLSFFWSLLHQFSTLLLVIFASRSATSDSLISCSHFFSCHAPSTPSTSPSQPLIPALHYSILTSHHCETQTQSYEAPSHLQVHHSSTSHPITFPRLYPLAACYNGLSFVSRLQGRPLYYSDMVQLSCH